MSKLGCFVGARVSKEFTNLYGFVGKTAKVLVPKSVITVDNDSAFMWIINNKTQLLC